MTAVPEPLYAANPPKVLVELGAAKWPPGFDWVLFVATARVVYGCAGTMPTTGVTCG